MTTVLAVALGLILMYLILSLIVSAVNEGLASFTDRRAVFLRKGLKNLVGQNLTTRFYDHGLIRGLTRKDARGRRNPSYLSSSTFGTVLIDLVSRSPEPSGNTATEGQVPADIGEFKRRVATLKEEDARDLGEALRTLANEAVDLSDLRKKIETWFNESMERVSGWYRRRTRVVLWLLAGGLVVSLNADTVNVARVLWLDPTVRSAAIVAARETAREEGTLQETGKGPAEIAEETVGAVRRLEEVGLPLRWSDETTPEDVPGWALKLLGLLITAFALTFGAPFWFDLLKRVVGVRATGPPPEEKERGKA